MGVYIGLVIEKRIMRYSYPYFYDTSFGATVLRILLSLIIGCPIVLIGRSLRWDSYYLFFRNIMPPFLLNIYLFGFSKWISLKFGLINKRIVSEDDDIVFYV